MKKILSFLLTAVIVAALVIGASAIELRETPTEAKNENEDGTVYFGLSNKDADENEYKCSNAYAWLKTPVGRLNFKVTFKLFWSAANLDENGTREDGTKYLSHFLAMYLTSDPANTEFMADVDGANKDTLLQYRLVNRHIQQVPWNVNNGDCDIADYGGYTISTNTMLNLGGIAQIILEAKTEGDRTTLYAYCLDGTTERAKCWTYRDGIFAADKDQYFCLGVGGSPVFAAFDFTVLESDIDGVAGTSPFDFEFKTSNDFDAIAPVGVFVENPEEETEETEEETEETEPETKAPIQSENKDNNKTETEKPEKNETNSKLGLIIGIIAAVIVIAVVIILIVKKKK